MYLLQKCRALKADYDKFLKEKNKDSFEPPPNNQYEANDEVQRSREYDLIGTRGLVDSVYNILWIFQSF